MKKNAKRLSAVLAVLMMSSAFAATVSAADSTFIKTGPKDATIEETADDTAAASEHIFKASGWIKTDAHVLKKTETAPEKSKITTVNPAKTNVKKTVYKNKKPCVVNGTYYSKKDAEAELKSYFDTHTYDLYMDEGDERLFCDGAYFVSTDTDVVYYDYRTGRLVANDNGSASVYVYTKGGVPFFRLDVNVLNKIGKRAPVIDLVPDEWQLDGKGDSTDFTIYCDEKLNEDKLFFRIAHGDDIASISKDGKLKVTGTGPIVVQIVDKSNPDIYGEALLYSGKYVSSFHDGYYTSTFDKKWNSNKYTTYYWGHDYDMCDYRDYRVNGWIKSHDGILIPVLSKFEANVLTGDGTTDKTTAVGYRNVSVSDILRDAYGDKNDLYWVIQKYNLFKH